ncbi:MAG TPA: hypothetical protein VHL10_00960, partial [Nitrososphaera sp.]|nr:hypothetical protein [Nitrososphaera sp.]
SIAEYPLKICIYDDMARIVDLWKNSFHLAVGCRLLPATPYARTTKRNHITLWQQKCTPFGKFILQTP